MLPRWPQVMRAVVFRRRRYPQNRYLVLLYDSLRWLTQSRICEFHVLWDVVRYQLSFMGQSSTSQILCLLSLLPCQRSQQSYPGRLHYRDKFNTKKIAAGCAHLLDWVGKTVHWPSWQCKCGHRWRFHGYIDGLCLWHGIDLDFDVMPVRPWGKQKMKNLHLT